MLVKRHNLRSAVTLIELLVTIVAATIVLLGITGILASGHKNFRTMYNRINGDVIRNAYEARRIFDRIVRQSSLEDGHIFPYEAYFYYYNIPMTSEGQVDIDAFRAIEKPNRFAHFYLEGRELKLAEGVVPIGTNLSLPDPPQLSPDSPPRTIAYNVDVDAYNANSIELFTNLGSAVRMVLILDNENPPNTPANKRETLEMTVTTTAIRHNRDAIVVP
jgi:hypothetical protein